MNQGPPEQCTLAQPPLENCTGNHSLLRAAKAEGPDQKSSRWVKREAVQLKDTGRPASHLDFLSE